MIGVGAVGGLGLVGIAISPTRVLSLSRPIDAGADVSAGDLTEAQRATADGLRTLIESAHALIDGRNTSAGSGELRLWIDDSRDHGVVNEDELLILTRAPLLHAVLALTRAPTDAPAPAVTSEDLFSDDLAARWRAQSAVDRAVVATDVTAMQVEQVGRTTDHVTLSVRLTFAAPESDLSNVRPVESVFIVSLPAVFRVR